MSLDNSEAKAVSRQRSYRLIEYRSALLHCIALHDLCDYIMNVLASTDSPPN